MRQRILCFWAVFVLLLFLNRHMAGTLYYQAAAQQISGLSRSSDAFRKMELSEQYLEALGELCSRTSAGPSEFLAPAMALGGFRLPAGIVRYGQEDYENLKYLLMRYNRSGFENLLEAFRAVWDDVEVFPVPGGGIAFENSWMFERTYGGLRGHEGVDLIPPRNLPGHYQVLSMTDGVVEKIGWLEKGGCRIGIRSPSGGYYYYAHLDSYAGEFAEGDEVEAGALLGYMGDTGYGPEGTTGKFAVHLHLGIYIAAEDRTELSVNPYWILRYLELRDRQK